jgi:hypothetical protein
MMAGRRAKGGGMERQPLRGIVKPSADEDPEARNRMLLGGNQPPSNKIFSPFNQTVQAVHHFSFSVVVCNVLPSLLSRILLRIASFLLPGVSLILLSLLYFVF